MNQPPSNCDESQSGAGPRPAADAASPWPSLAQRPAIRLPLLAILALPLLASNAGKDWGVERTSYTDPVTGFRVYEMTGDNGAAFNLYYHFPNFTADNRYVIFGSERGGSRQIYRVGVSDGRVVQLTDAENVNAAGACPDHTDSRRVYYTRGADVLAVDIETFESRKVATVPGAVTSGLGQPTLSGDGRSMAIGFQRDATTWEIGLIDTRSGEYRTVIQQGFRIGHVQHSPTNPLIFYVWETGGYAPQRSWIVNTDGTGNRPFYFSTDPKRWVTPLKEWMTHEAWVPNTGDMTMIMDKVGVVLVKKDGSWQMVREGNYWHVMASPDGSRLVLDDFQGRIWVMETATGNTRLIATEVRKPGLIHAHPSWDREGRRILFNRTRNGRQTVAMVELDETLK